MKNERWLISVSEVLLLCASVSIASQARVKEPLLIETMLETGSFTQVRAFIATFQNTVQQAEWRSKLEFFEGNYAAATDEAARAATLDPSRTDIQELKEFCRTLRGIHLKDQEFESEHFRLKAQGRDVILSRYALDALEKAYVEIGGELHYFPEEKVLVEVYQFKDDFSIGSTLGSAVVEKSGTVGICKFNRIMILSPQSTALGYPWLDTLAHEYTHFLINRLSQGACPLWLHEGIARYFESRWRLKIPDYLTRDAENHLFEARKKKTYISFAKMHPSIVYLKDQDEMALAFAEVSSAISYLRGEHPGDSVSNILKNIPLEGLDKSFKKVLGEGSSQFEKKFFAYVETLPLREARGVMRDQAEFTIRPEDDYIGTDQKGTIRLGDRFRSMGRADAALIEYEKALSAEPDNPVILVKIARAQLALNKADEARKSLEQAITSNPGYVTPYQILGELEFHSENYAKAAEILRQAIAINPFHPPSHRMLFRSQLALKDSTNALYELRIAVFLDPTDIESKVILERWGR